MAWIYLALAAIFEVGFAISMKASNGFTVLWPSVITVVGIAGGFFFLALALKTLPVSVGYPLWVGAGAVGTVLFGAIVFGEALTLAKVASVTLIVAGVVGLKLTTTT